MINFIAGGMMGDFIHSLHIVKNMCLENNCKANLFIAEGYGDVWRFSLQKTLDDLKDLISQQSYIEYFGILDRENMPKMAIDLTKWRTQLVKDDFGYTQCWTDVLTKCYTYNIPKEYKWLNITTPNPITKDKIIIHRSVHRHNGGFPWEKIIEQLKDEQIYFLMCSDIEWQVFPFKKENIIPLHMPTVSYIANSISECKMFIGNQSAPFSIACALDIPRLVELDWDPAAFYMGESKYSNNISWFLNDNKKFNHVNNIIKL